MLYNVEEKDVIKLIHVDRKLRTSEIMLNKVIHLYVAPNRKLIQTRNFCSAFPLAPEIHSLTRIQCRRHRKNLHLYTLNCE